MQTTNIRCGHCGSVMAVATDSLGQQVRCPHCLQVVLSPSAPSPAPSEPPTTGEPGLDPSDVDHPESIFSETHDEDLFNAGPRHVVEMPPEPARPEPAPPSPDLEELPPIPAGLSAIHPAPAPEPVAEGEAGRSPAAETTGAEPSPWQTEPAGDFQTDLTVEPRTEERVQARPARGGAAALLLTLLVPYSVLMTAIAAYLYWKDLQAQGKPPPGAPATPSSSSHPLEMLPDEGLNPGARRVLRGNRFPAEGKEAELPPQLRVALGETLRIGDLEVTPRDVRLRWITVHTETFNPSRERALVLSLHLKNLSTNVTFRPVDPFFDRTWKEGDPNGKPYTYLEMGDKRFYGGPIEWENAVPGRDTRRQSIPEQHQDRQLKPGEEMDTIVCTNPQAKVENALSDYHGPLLWRVQLRRGLVEVRGKDASATAVIGVEFRESDVKTTDR